MADCIFATYSGLPELDPHDRLLAERLRDRGVSVAPGVWTDPSVDWSSARLCVVRSTWDYHRSHAAFMSWLDRAAAMTAVRNAPETIRWNSHKFYLRDLERVGVPVIPTEWLSRGEPASLEALCERHAWTDVIIKPAHGASSHDVLHVKAGPEGLRAGQSHLAHLLSRQDVLLQPYLHTLQSYPERALIFIGGAYSHAVEKTLFQTALPNGEAGDAPLVHATHDEIAVATRALATLTETPLFARVDLVRDDRSEVRLLELELIEPTLFLSMYPPAADALADAIVEELNALK